MQPDEAVRIGEDEGAEAIPGGFQRVGPGRSEMRRVPDPDRADAGFSGEAAGMMGCEIGRAGAVGVVGFKKVRARPRATEGEARPRVQAPAPERRDVMGQEADAMAVHAVEAAMHHSACGVTRSFFVRPDR
jgi:hypothetical protein